MVLRLGIFPTKTAIQCLTGDTSNLLLLTDPFGPTKTSSQIQLPFLYILHYVVVESFKSRKPIPTHYGDVVFEARVLEGDFSGLFLPFVTLQNVITSDKRCGEGSPRGTGHVGDDRERINVASFDVVCYNKPHRKTLFSFLCYNVYCSKTSCFWQTETACFSMKAWQWNHY